MRVLKVFGLLALIAFMSSFYLFTCNYYDPLKDNFTYFDFDSFISNVEKEEETSDDIIAAEMVPISFGNLFSVRYKYYRLVGFFGFSSLFITFSFVFLIISKFCKKTLYETLKDMDDRIMYFMSSIFVGLVLVIVFVYIYNIEFLNKNKVHELYIKNANPAIVEVMK